MAHVTAALVIAKRADGSDVYLYEGATLPGGLLDGEEARLITAGLVAGDVDAEDGYSSFKVADLKAEIDRRNDGREEADLISPEGKKDDLVAALEADDNK